ncbi:MAG: dihydroneopterin aldolase [Anaerolineales bacterium]|nr:dihydroneopterin aldolase [Anaerolineales bacterium]
MAEDQILIKDLLLRGIVGINDWEREKRQDILINITLTGDLSKAGQTDAIEDTINYRTITKRVIEMVENGEPYTVEHLAARIAEICLDAQGVLRARVRVEKPGALRFARSVGVEIERTRTDLA